MQAAKDLTYFAQNVKLPQPGGEDLTADKAPWVLIGGSYAGKFKCSFKRCIRHHELSRCPG